MALPANIRLGWEGLTRTSTLLIFVIGSRAYPIVAHVKVASLGTFKHWTRMERPNKDKYAS